MDGEDAIGWFSAEDLHLYGVWAIEWEAFTFSLTLAGIKINDNGDNIMWCLNKQRGDVTALLDYKALAEKHLRMPHSWCMSLVCNGKLPTKIQCFIWLTLKKIILTLEGLQKREIYRLGRCCFCCATLETMEHIFGECYFFIDVYN